MIVIRIQKEVRLMVLFLLYRLFNPAPAEPISHGRLEHAHWDRAGRRWVTHGEAGDAAEPLARVA